MGEASQGLVMLCARQITWDLYACIQRCINKLEQHWFVLQTLDKYERSAIADVLEAEYFDQGATIIMEGTPGDKFYFLEEVT